MRYFFWLIVFVALFAGAGFWLTEHESYVTLTWGNYIVETKRSVFIALATLSFVALWTCVSSLQWLVRAPKRIIRYFRRKKEIDSWKQLALGFSALASGDVSKALRHAKYAKKAVTEDTAQLVDVLQMSVASQDAHAVTLKDLCQSALKNPESEPVALKNLYEIAAQEGNAQQELHYLEAAYRKYVELIWPLEPLLSFYEKNRQFDSARDVLKRLKKQKLKTADQICRHEILYTLEEAWELIRQGNYSDAVSYSYRAYRLDKTFVPAIYSYAFALAKADKAKKAIKCMIGNWRKSPHAMIARLLEHLVGMQPRDQIIRYSKQIWNAKPDHYETVCLYARLLIKAKQLDEAKAVLLKAVQISPSRLLYELLAEATTAQGGDAEGINNYLKKALDLPQSPQWVCRECHELARDWKSLCEYCQAFDTLEWQVPNGTKTSRS